jgi:hypothetical protein
MAISVGSAMVGKVYIGSTQASKVYLGSTQVFPSYSAPNVVTSGLLTHYNFALSTTYPGTGSCVFDISGCSRNGTLTNGAVYTNECLGGIAFDGTNDFIDLLNANPISGNSPLSIEFWFKLTARGAVNYCEPLANLSNDAPNRMRLYMVEGNTTPEINVKNYANDYYSGVGFTPGTINHLLVTEDTSNCIRIYKNGSLAASGTRSTTNTTGLQYYLARYQFDNRYYNGIIYEHRLYNRPLNSTEVSCNWNETKSRYGC